MSDDPSGPHSNSDAEVELDIREFLPEGTELDDGLMTDLDDDWGDDAPEPEVPAWARTDSDQQAPPVEADGVAEAAEVESEPENVQQAEDEPETEPENRLDEPHEPEGDDVDLTVLEGVEADLLEVDEAIAALDAGDPARSALLQRLTSPSSPA